MLCCPKRAAFVVAGFSRSAQPDTTDATTRLEDALPIDLSDLRPHQPLGSCAANYRRHELHRRATNRPRRLGKTQRRRLNRGGHRQANAALYRAVLIGLRWNPKTQAYVRRRTAEGLSKREIIRRLKRNLARSVYRIIMTSMAQTVPQPSTA
ncbi:hypothetical protein [Kutzneria buriramensis]|uniref:Transposase IS116/IS110/IS902 family protein n=1 Tax=Kutzneria buriramensis TaxID=1045776 RepID=A0A3E0GV29_9PSEU|nr:hypothetical protein BCF44_12656 [Kutzneria buriramensis]